MLGDLMRSISLLVYKAVDGAIEVGAILQLFSPLRRTLVDLSRADTALVFIEDHGLSCCANRREPYF